MAEKQGVTEQVKMQDQMKWVGLMNGIKACAEEIVKRCRENSFKSVRFSYDQAIPNALYVIVYGSNWQVKNGKALFSFSYLPGDMNGTYNIVNDSEKYILRVEHN